MSGDDDVELTDALIRPRSSAGLSSFVPRMPSQAFAVPRHAMRVRRPTDVVLLVFTLALLLWSTLTADETERGFRAALTNLIATTPNLLDPVWQVLHDLLLVWTLFVIVLALARRHMELVRDLAIAAVAVVVSAALVGRLGTGTWPDLWEGALRQEAPVDFPPLLLSAGQCPC